MAANKVQICNMALARIGESSFINNLDEQSKQAEVCSLFYDSALNRVFRDIKPQNRKTYLALALVTEKPNTEWAFAYRYPSDVSYFDGVILETGAVKIAESELYRPTEYDLKPYDHYQVEYTRGKYNGTDVIFTNMEEAKAIVFPKPDPSEMLEDDLASLIAWNLAKEVVMPLAAEPSRRQIADAEYRKESAEVVANLGNEEHHHDPEPAFIQIRGGY
jgi:hypothetical protein